MRKNSNDMKHWGVYVIRLKKNKFSKHSRSRTNKLSPPLNLTFALQPYVNSLSEANLPMFQLVQFVPPQPNFCLTALCVSLRQNISLKISQISETAKKSIPKKK